MAHFSDNVDVERIHRMVIAALYTNSALHKQYYLVEIAEELGIPAKDWEDLEKGIAS